MNYYNYRHYIDNVMQALNGNINKNLKCYEHSYVYQDDNICAKNNNGSIRFNLQYIGYRHKELDILTNFAFLIRIVAHELSHCDQDVNYRRYQNDFAYRSWIEKSNDLNAVCYIMDNLNMVKRLIGDFNHSIFLDSYYYAKKHGINYVSASKSKLVSNIMEDYMIDTSKTRYKDMDTILMNINDTRYMIKHNGEVIDPNVLYPAINYITKFNEFRVFNSLQNNNTLIIKVVTSDKHKKIEDVIYRIDKKYII